MSYIVEILLPNNDSRQYEFTERYTIDAIKREVFKQTEELANFKKEDFELGISEEERLSIEFYKLLGYKGHFKERAEQGLPIMLGLYKKQAPLTPIKFQKSLSTSLSSSATSPILLQQSSSPSLSRSQQNINVRNSFSDIQKLQLSLSSIDILKIQRNSVNNQIPNFSSTLGEKDKEQEEGNSLSSSASSAESPRGLSSSAPLMGSPISSISPGSPTTSRTRTSSRSIKALFTKSNSKSSSDLIDAGINSPNNNNNNMAGKSIKEEMSATDLSAMLMARDDWASSEEMKMIAQNQFGFHFEIGLNSMKLDQFNLDIFVLEIPKQENLFEKYFLNSDHKNYAGEVEGIGPVFISVLKEKQKGHTRALIRVPQQTFHLCVEHTAASSSKSLKAILAKHNQKINQKSLKCIKSPDLIKELEKFDNSHVVKTFKFGALYCKDGQTTEEEWFGNEHGSKEFYEFLDLIGERITLNGWKKFRGGLDVNGNSTGTESYYTTHTDFEIMFHVSTLLPYFEADEQKIERKRHLGNDIVVIIYKEGSTLFPPSICKSVFNHTYIVVSKENDNYYRVELTIKDGVKPFGPPFPFPGLIHKDIIGEFLLVKMMNAEWAAYKSLEFSHKFKRTRNLQLATLLEKFSV